MKATLIGKVLVTTVMTITSLSFKENAQAQYQDENELEVSLCEELETSGVEGLLEAGLDYNQIEFIAYNCTLEHANEDIADKSYRVRQRPGKDRDGKSNARRSCSDSGYTCTIR